MAIIKLAHTTIPKDIEINISTLGMNLSSREAMVKIEVQGFPIVNEHVDMLPTYQALTDEQKTLIKAWYRTQIALAVNQKFGTVFTWQDIPDTIFNT